MRRWTLTDEAILATCITLDAADLTPAAHMHAMGRHPDALLYVPELASWLLLARVAAVVPSPIVASNGTPLDAAARATTWSVIRGGRERQGLPAEARAPGGDRAPVPQRERIFTRMNPPHTSERAVLCDYRRAHENGPLTASALCRWCHAHPEHAAALVRCHEVLVRQRIGQWLALIVQTEEGC